MPSTRRLALNGIAILAGSAIFLWFGTALQRTASDIFASPDETATSVFADAYTVSGGFRISHGLPDELADVQELHPRSVVRQSAWLVPVGFLGMPMLVSIAERIRDGFGSLVTPLLVLSSSVPLYLLARRRSRRSAVLTVLLYLSFPIVILYSNRALFPNLPVVSCALWATWGWSAMRGGCRNNWKSVATMVVAGCATGLAFIIRPVEAVWFIPWLVWGALQQGEIMPAVTERLQVKTITVRVGIAALVALAVMAVGWSVGRQTYGPDQGLLPIGYHLRDDAGIKVAAAADVPADSWALSRILPFGIHPRTLWLNVRSYAGTVFGIWFGLALIGAAADAYARRTLNRRDVAAGGIVLWTLIVLLFLYGQSAYTDNINGGVTIGNSFLRYLLPLAPIIAFGCALAIDRLFLLQRYRGIVAGPIAAILLVMFGVVTAYARDEEGVLRTSYELERYVAIREIADVMLPQGAIIISERSDKIFVSGPYVAVSPIPSEAAIARIRDSGSPAYYFTRTFAANGDRDPVASAFERATPVFTLQNETMYRLNGRIE